ncbi:hypothetical protein ACFL59_16320, partial [Planctomycetota bacterium]
SREIQAELEARLAREARMGRELRTRLAVETQARRTLSLRLARRPTAPSEPQKARDSTPRQAGKDPTAAKLSQKQIDLELAALRSSTGDPSLAERKRASVKLAREREARKTLQRQAAPTKISSEDGSHDARKRGTSELTGEQRSRKSQEPVDPEPTTRKRGERHD